MDYGLLLIIGAYLGALQLATRTNTGALLCSFVAVGLPYIVSLVIRWIFQNSSDLTMIAGLFTFEGITTLILQLAALFVVFKKVQNQDDLVAVIGWSIGGFVVAILLIPFVVQQII